jgi:hypothetical protein
MKNILKLKELLCKMNCSTYKVLCPATNSAPTLVHLVYNSLLFFVTHVRVGSKNLTVSRSVSLFGLTQPQILVLDEGIRHMYDLIMYFSESNALVRLFQCVSKSLVPSHRSSLVTLHHLAHMMTVRNESDIKDA